MDAGLFIGVMSALSAFYILLGWSVSKGMKNSIDFFFAGKQLNVIPITATLLATQIGGGMFIGTAQSPFRGMLYILGMVIGFVALSRGIAERFRQFNVETVAEIFEKQYQSYTLGKVCAFLSVITLSGILLSQTLAMHEVINNFTGPYTGHIFPVLWAIIILYTLLGGLKAVVMVDLVQVCIVITVFSIFFFFSIATETYSYTALANNLKTIFKASQLSLGEMFRILLVTSCFSIITQDVAQRFFAAKDKKTATKAALLASIILLAFAIIPFYFGVKAYFLTATNHESTFFLALQNVASGAPVVLAMCALMAAITSTADSLLCAIAAILSSLVGGFFKSTVKNEVLLSQGIILICGLIIFVLSYHMPRNIIDLLVSSYEISVVCLFVPLMIACFRDRKKLNAPSAYLAVGCGGCALALFTIFPITVGFWSLPLSLGLSAFGYWTGDQLSTKT